MDALCIGLASTHSRSFEAMINFHFDYFQRIVEVDDEEGIEREHNQKHQQFFKGRGGNL